MRIRQIAFAGAMLAASSGFAAVAPHEVRLPAESVQGSIHFVSGGIGREEAQAFRRARRAYPLSFEFAVKGKTRDEFTADVKVVIRDEKGKTVLDTVSDGPFLLARMPEGKYDVEATQGGKTLERHVSVVDRKPVSVGFVWPAG